MKTSWLFGLVCVMAVILYIVLPEQREAINQASLFLIGAFLCAAVMLWGVGGLARFKRKPNPDSG